MFNPLAMEQSAAVSKSPFPNSHGKNSFSSQIMPCEFKSKDVYVLKNHSMKIQVWIETMLYIF